MLQRTQNMAEVPALAWTLGSARGRLSVSRGPEIGQMTTSSQMGRSKVADKCSSPLKKPCP